jgi:hypothetical protein
MSDVQEAAKHQPTDVTEPGKWKRFRAWFWCLVRGACSHVWRHRGYYSAGVLAVAVWLCFARIPAPKFRSPSFWDVLVGNRFVVAAIRVAILFGVAFAIFSIVVLIGRKQPITKFGPSGAEVSQVQDKSEAQEDLYLKTRDERDLLLQRLQESDQEMVRFRRSLQRARREIMLLRSQLNPRLGLDDSDNMGSEMGGGTDG